MVPTGRKHFVYPDCIDGRKNFNGLTGIVRSELQSDPLMVMSISSRRSLKLLFYEYGGFVVYHKKLDRGIFASPPLRADGEGRFISEVQLLQVIRGLVFQKEKQLTVRQKEEIALEQ